MSIVIADKWRILDFNVDDISQATYEYLQNFVKALDINSDEHLISICSAFDEAGDSLSLEVMEELIQLKRHADKNDSFYIRFINY